MSPELVVAVAVVFGPMGLIVASIFRVAGPAADHRAPLQDLPGEAGLRWPTESSSVPRDRSGEPAADGLLPSRHERHLRHG